MQKNFSPQLIERAQRIFKERSGRFVSAEETEICLATLAKLGRLALRIIKTAKPKKDEPDYTHR
jgi:hypothetical protein